MRMLLEEDRRARQGAYLLFASLGIFFLSSMFLFVIYVALRLRKPTPDVRDYGLPPSFLLSTLLLVGISLALHRAVQMARQDRGAASFRLSLVALGLALAFFAAQSHGMYDLVTRALLAAVPGYSPYPLTFVLAFLHALHVVGGMVALVAVIANAYRREYDHERSWGIQFCALYWHFLDFVWLVMMAGFLVAAQLIHLSTS